MKIWKIGIIGCGNLAETVYIPQMARIKNAQIMAVCDRDGRRAKTVAEKFGISQWYDNVDDLLEKSDVEICMSVASIIGRHEINMKILKAGKHLYSQKPFAPDVRSATEPVSVSYTHLVCVRKAYAAIEEGARTALCI